MKRLRVSVLILTKNEEANLPGCLKALRWCDDVVLLDSGSTDRTLAIAREHGARVLEHPFETFADQRNFGLEHGELKHEWVLHIDADEIVTEALAARLAGLSPGAGIDAYRVPSKTMFFGRWLRRAGMYPAYQVRLGHRERLRFREVGHGQREALPPEKIATLDEPYLHYSFSRGLGDWLARHVRYAAAESAVIVEARRSAERVSLAWALKDRTTRRRWLKSLSHRTPIFARPAMRFAYVYFLRRGFLEGSRGFLYAFMLSVYEGMIAILLAEQLWREGAAGARSRTRALAGAPVRGASRS